MIAFLLFIYFGLLYYIYILYIFILYLYIVVELTSVLVQYKRTN